MCIEEPAQTPSFSSRFFVLYEQRRHLALNASPAFLLLLWGRNAGDSLFLNENLSVNLQAAVLKQK